MCIRLGSHLNCVFLGQWLCVMILYRIWQWSQSEVTEHLNLILRVSREAVLYIQVWPVYYGRCFLVCGLNPGSQQELIHSIVKSVAESLKQALCPLTRDDCFHSPCSSLEVLKTSALGAWRRDMKVWFGVMGVGSICVYVWMKYLMMSMKIGRLRYVLCVWDIKVWEVSVSDWGFDKAYGFLSVHIRRL